MSDSSAFAVSIALVAMISVPVSMSFDGSSMTWGRALMSDSAVEHQALALQDARAFAARDHHDFVPGARQVRSQDGAERSRAEDCELHALP